jgi:hypothetical protein
VDSRPDALIHKARIAIQISPSGRQSALVLTRVLQLKKLPNRLQPSGRLPIMVRTREALYGSYLHRTCDRPDDCVLPSGRGSQTGKIFSENLGKFGRTVVRPDGPSSPSRRRPYILQQSPILHLSLFHKFSEKLF